MEQRGWPLAVLAERVGVSRTTLAGWAERWSKRHSAITARGRPPERPPRAVRNEVIETLRSEGTGVGIPELLGRFPGVARRELEELRARYAYCARRRGDGEVLYRLEWTRPGTVWAGDFTFAPCPIDGVFPKIELVRDLASHQQLLAQPSSGESAEEVALALESLFLEHGPPLVLKADNGPGYTAQATRDLCDRHGVLILYSPPRTPSYNGACEAGAGSIKNRVTRIAHAAGRPTAWTADDVERGRQQCNHCVRVQGVSPCQLWTSRTPVSDLERQGLLEAYLWHQAVERGRQQLDQDVRPKRADLAMIDRAALAAALIERDLLKVRRG